MYTKKMIEFTVNYKSKYRLKNNQNYIYSTCGLCFNLKTNNIIKQITKGYTIGYIIDGKFKSLKVLRSELEITPKQTKPPF
jgi:hypothetical protein